MSPLIQLFLAISPEEQKRMQSTLAWKFSEDVNIYTMKLVTGKDGKDDVCQWKGLSNPISEFQVLCIGGIWRSLRVVNIKSVMHPKYLPNGLQSVMMTQCDQHYKYDMQYLPRSSQDVCLAQNKLLGSLNLDDLPQEIEQLGLASNLFSGRISLTNLPPTLTALDLSKNKLRNSVVYYMHVPENLSALNLHGSGIRALESLDGDEEARQRVRCALRGMCRA